MSLRRSKIQAKPNIVSKRGTVTNPKTTPRLDSVTITNDQNLKNNVTTRSTAAPLQNNAATDATETDCYATPEDLKNKLDSDITDDVHGIDSLENHIRNDHVAVKTPTKEPAVISRRFAKVKPNLSASSRSKRNAVHSTPTEAKAVSTSADNLTGVFSPTLIPDLSDQTVGSPTIIPESDLVTVSETVVIETQAYDDPTVADGNNENIPNDKRSASSTAAAETVKPKRVIKRLPAVTAPRDKPPDKFTMKMADLIRWNPIANPMKPKDTAKVRVAPKAPVALDEITNKEPDTGDEDSMPVPQIKIGPDGNVIINEASLVIETLQPVVTEDDFGEAVTEDDHSSVNYYSFRKGRRPKYWSIEETQKFFWALSRVGTDFSLMTKIFPGRPRSDLKLKFKKEERKNRPAVETALVSDMKDFEMSVFENPFIPKPKKTRAEKAEEKKIKRGKNKILSYYEDSETWTVDLKRANNKQENVAVIVQPAETIEVIGGMATTDASTNITDDEGDEEDDTHRTIAKADIPRLSDDEEERILESMSKTTRYGRKPKRVQRSTGEGTPGGGKRARPMSPEVGESGTMNGNARISENMDSACSVVSRVERRPGVRVAAEVDASSVHVGSFRSPSATRPLDVNQLRSIAASPGSQLILVKQPAQDGSSKSVVHVYMLSPPHQRSGVPSQGLPSQGVPSQGVSSQGLAFQRLPNQRLFSQGTSSVGLTAASSMPRPSVPVSSTTQSGELSVNLLPPMSRFANLAARTDGPPVIAEARPFGSPRLTGRDVTSIPPTESPHSSSGPSPAHMGCSNESNPLESSVTDRFSTQIATNERNPSPVDPRSGYRVTGVSRTQHPPRYQRPEPTTVPTTIPIRPKSTTYSRQILNSCLISGAVRAKNTENSENTDTTDKVSMDTTEVDSTDVDSVETYVDRDNRIRCKLFDDTGQSEPGFSDA